MNPVLVFIDASVVLTCIVVFVFFFFMKQEKETTVMRVTRFVALISVSIAAIGATTSLVVGLIF